MENINYLDIAVLSLVAILGFKGILNGLVKEFFGLFGIIGGVFVASRYSLEAGKFINDTFYKFQNESALNLVGFIAVLLAFWIVAIIVGRFVAKLIQLSGLGFIDKLFGFAFGAGKVFLIFSIIIYALSNVEIVRKNVTSFTENSFVYPILVEAGSVIVRLDTSSFDIGIPKEQNQSSDNNSSQKGE